MAPRWTAAGMKSSPLVTAPQKAPKTLPLGHLAVVDRKAGHLRIAFDVRDFAQAHAATDPSV
jgi:hypothetical protein